MLSNFDVFSLRRAILLCNQVSFNLFDSLKKRPELEGKVIFPEGDRSDSFCFRLRFVLPEGADFFSTASLRSVYDPFGYDEQWE